MAYCGTVTLHDKDGVGGYTIRYGGMPEGDILGLRDRMVADVATLRSNGSFRGGLRRIGRFEHARSGKQRPQGGQAGSRFPYRELPGLSKWRLRARTGISRL